MYGGPVKRGLRWVQGLGRFDLIVAIFWWCSSLGVAIGGAGAWFGIVGGLSISDCWQRYGMEAVDPSTSFIPGSAGNFGASPKQLPGFSIIANCPQLWLSIGYLLWNNQITRIWTEHEWRAYYCKSQRPRVSYKTSDSRVRATRWLQLPYSITTVLMIVNTTLHWLVSQTLFVVEINDGGSMSYYLNYSPLAMFLVGIASLLLVLSTTIYYFIPIATWMPLLANSAGLVFESCEMLSAIDLPDDGLVAWGDISTRNMKLAGFGLDVKRVENGIIYPSVIGGSRIEGIQRTESATCFVNGGQCCH